MVDEAHDLYITNIEHGAGIRQYIEEERRRTGGGFNLRWMLQQQQLQLLSIGAVATTCLAFNGSSVLARTPRVTRASRFSATRTLVATRTLCTYSTAWSGTAEHCMYGSTVFAHRRSTSRSSLGTSSNVRTRVRRQRHRLHPWWQYQHQHLRRQQQHRLHPLRPRHCPCLSSLSA